MAAYPNRLKIDLRKADLQRRRSFLGGKEQKSQKLGDTQIPSDMKNRSLFFAGGEGEGGGGNKTELLLSINVILLKYIRLIAIDKYRHPLL